jgi:hypothetical protein
LAFINKFLLYRQVINKPFSKTSIRRVISKKTLSISKTGEDKNTNTSLGVNEVGE